MPAWPCSWSTATTTWASRRCSTATGTPKGSFYHHFKDKEDFALQVVDQYMRQVHAGLDACLGDERRPPLDRVRRFFELHAADLPQEGYMGCLLGGLGQELSGVSEVFRARSRAALGDRRPDRGLPGSRRARRGDIPADADPRQMASLLVDCWEGRGAAQPAAGDPAPLNAMLDFYFRAAAVPTAGRAPRARGAAKR